ncbi:hypothetical protein EVAR_25966_1 [Eumeta japonica]|uniref:Uncharacterized protein n=1 Tax=Eumeta variegata TaxID=151549 RepID=A0A4C1V2P7_EUMVA|nr:hypothetical protein EVAR_25966_1 [Eumeta japonica]
MEYRILLPDHDWVVAERHKLIPSVYAGVKVEPNNFGKEEAVGYSGPTHISIRSGNTHPLQRTPMLMISNPFINTVIQTLNDDRIEHREASDHHLCRWWA